MDEWTGQSDGRDRMVGQTDRWTEETGWINI